MNKFNCAYCKLPIKKMLFHGLKEETFTSLHFLRIWAFIAEASHNSTGNPEPSVLPGLVVDLSRNPTNRVNWDFLESLLHARRSLKKRSNSSYNPSLSLHFCSAHTYSDLIKEFKSAVWVIEGDISKCFDTFDHDFIMKCLETRISCEKPGIPQTICVKKEKKKLWI